MNSHEVESFLWHLLSLHAGRAEHDRLSADAPEKAKPYTAGLSILNHVMS